MIIGSMLTYDLTRLISMDICLLRLSDGMAGRVLVAMVENELVVRFERVPSNQLL